MAEDGSATEALDKLLAEEGVPPREGDEAALRAELGQLLQEEQGLVGRKEAADAELRELAEQERRFWSEEVMLFFFWFRSLRRFQGEGQRESLCPSP